jgi:hypothetical protein
MAVRSSLSKFVLPNTSGDDKVNRTCMFSHPKYNILHRKLTSQNHGTQHKCFINSSRESTASMAVCFCLQLKPTEKRA